MSSELQVAVVVPVRNNESALGELFERLESSLGAADRSWTVVFVDDSSTDASWQEIVRIHSAAPDRTQGIRLARSFGQVAAIAAGVEATSTPLIVYLDADLEYDPEDVPNIIERLLDGADMVNAERPPTVNRPPVRRLLSAMVKRFGPSEIREQLTDPGSGMKGWRRPVWTSALEQPGLCRDPLILLAHLRACGRVDNVAVNWRPPRDRSAYRTTDLVGSFVAMATASGAPFTAMVLLGPVAMLGGAFTAILARGRGRSSESAVAAGFVAGTWLSSTGVLGLYVQRVVNSAGPLYRVAETRGGSVGG